MKNPSKLHAILVILQLVYYKKVNEFLLSSSEGLL